MNLPSHASRNLCRQAREEIARLVGPVGTHASGDMVLWLLAECDQLDTEYQSANREADHWQRAALRPGQPLESPERCVRSVNTGCLQCGAALTPSPRGGPRKRYCGPACRYRYRHTRERAAVEQVNQAAVNLRAVFAHLDDKRQT